jgi:hypothetical protein
MPRKRTSPKLDNDEFAVRVIDACQRITRGEPIKEPERDVRRVAIGLVVLQHAIKLYLPLIAADKSPFSGAESGIVHANEILEALTTSRAHPIFNHIEGLRSPRFRANSPGPTPTERLIRTYVAGLAVAYQKATGVRQTPACNTISQVCQFPDFRITGDQVKSFKRRGDPKDIAAAAKYFTDWAQRHTKPPRKVADGILTIGRKTVADLVTVPVLDAG